jgi:SNF2 family DNA or RNA helicase
MTSAFLTIHNKALVLNEIGTGKTQSALWACDYLMEIGKIRKVLVISPLSTLERVWGDSIFKSFPHRQAVTLHGTSARRKQLLKTQADFFIINHDGFQIIEQECRNMFDLIIIDEAAVLRNPSTNRFKIIRKFMERETNTRLWLMTGTPTPNDPTDAWALAKLVESPFNTKTYTAFRESVMLKISQWKWVPRVQSIDTVKQVLYPSVRYTRDECFDLPETVFQTRKVALTSDQTKHYNKMLKHFATELEEEGTITAVNEAVKLQKLVQISCGVVYGDEGDHIEVDCSPRVNVVQETIEQVDGKVIVFVPLTGTLRMLERALSKQWSVAVVNGEVSATKRNKIFHDFQNADNPHVLIAHPATMAHGLTLTRASTIIWYGPVTSNEQYIQANGRIERIGKKHVSNIIHIEATELEYKMYERLRSKQKLQGLLLDLIKKERKE